MTENQLSFPDFPFKKQKSTAVSHLCPMLMYKELIGQKHCPYESFGRTMKSEM
jgi:hypothetical protein